MRAVVQRVRESVVTVDDRVVGRIDIGLLVLVGAEQRDSEEDAAYIAKKVATLRIFPDEEGKMNRSVEEVGGAVLVVSQFTLCGDCRKGRRPSFAHAMHPELALPLVERVGELLQEKGLSVETGEFGAMMDVALVNDGPVTLLLDSERRF